MNELLTAFEAIGARATIAYGRDAFALDIVQRDGREQFQLTYPASDTIVAEVMDVKPKLRHLVLDVSGWRLPIAGRYLCGHDERHWFAAQLAFGRRTTTVHGAMEELKPAIVRRDQKRRGVKHRRYRRKTAAYVRQGEWFFLPRPKMRVDDDAVHNGRLVRDGGKPHRVEWLYWNAERDETFVRGAVSHPDHATIHLDVWHRVVENNETDPVPMAQPFTRLDYWD